MESLEMLLVGLFPQNTIKVDVENDGKIVINIDDKKSNSNYQKQTRFIRLCIQMWIFLWNIPN